jgi:hypothetical protein
LEDAVESVQYFRPISLMDSFAKLFMKVLASRIGKRVNKMIAIGWSAFIKVRCIQDNFMYMCGLLHRLHRTKKPSILLKLDIVKAFLTIFWSYLLDIM